MANGDVLKMNRGLFATADSDGNGCVTYDELLAYLQGSPQAKGKGLSINDVTFLERGRQK